MVYLTFEGTQDNLSRGNMGAVEQLQALFPEPGRLQFVYGDLGDSKRVNEIFAQNAIDAVMHFAAIAYVSESMADPLRYYHNITFNTLTVLEAMKTHGVKKLIYSSTCATYGEPEKMPITEITPQVFHWLDCRIQMDDVQVLLLECNDSLHRCPRTGTNQPLWEGQKNVGGSDQGLRSNCRLVCYDTEVLRW